MFNKSEYKGNKLLQFYAVKDVLVGSFLAPTLYESENTAKRSFKSQINNIQIWKDNPTDFDLWRLGTFDTETGEIIYKPEKICGGRSVINV